jgi:four helix bundle protein
MAGIRRFEEIDAWQKARELTRAIYQVTRSGAFAHDYGLKDQIRRAAVSIMSNIAEGFGRGGNREFVQFLSVARGSVAEVQAQLYVALDAGYIQNEQFDSLFRVATETGNLVGGFMRYLNATDQRGHKFKTNSAST